MSHVQDQPTGSTADEQGTDDPTTTDAALTRKRRRTAVVVAIAVLVVAAVVTAVLAVRVSASTPAEAVSATAPVPISVAHVPDGTKIGVVVTLGDGEGAQWDDAAQGALVAQRRLELGGTDVQLVTKNDGGSTDGARKAVEALAADGVSGIVVASSGDHVRGAFAAAADAGIPVVAPYAAGADDAWSTAPSTESVAAALQDALGDAAAPLLVDLGGGAPSGVRFAHVLDATSTPDLGALATTIAQRTGAAAGSTDAPTTDATTTDAQAGTTTGAAQESAMRDSSEQAAPDSDAVVVSGPAGRQGALVAALQEANVTAPVVLTPEATSPAFAAALAQAGGSLSGTFRTVGVETDDARALSSDAEGRAMSAFLGGVRVLADDADAKNLTGDRSFASVASVADARSHDAVVALVAAVGSARSADAAEVSDALAALDLDAGDGLAGPALDFGSRQALGDRAGVLAASAQDLGLRPASATEDAGATEDGGPTPALVWFADSSD
ncbi:hypothetical protein C1N91_14570 [Curtobacterium sp. SGAir0471]|uniref:hypothetical protein n=1 Tax=Curtobacterium sp. SGAir0471 TaxID=2070337 RepID=UPI0010CD4368|nr:hypothetical protein [Curtobacterium sp. SGAir0471]QCR44562.1 hypothetical protein C1N91_14570 [Curtobacterium sp. SGAir0471]